MNAFKILKNHIHKIKNITKNDRKVKNKPQLSKPNSKHDDNNPIALFFESMGPVTLTEIIKRRIDRYIINEYELDEVGNKGRYYIARLSEANGSVVHTMLVDRQSGMVRSLYRKPAGKMRS